MKVVLVISLSLVMCATLLWLIKTRKNEQEKHAKQYRLLDIKLRVTSDVVEEFRSELAEKKDQMMKSQGAQKQMEEQVEQLQAKTEKAKNDMDQCQGDQKSALDQLAMAETALNDLKATSTKEMTGWQAEMDVLRKQLAERSSICDFLREETELTRKLCEKKDGGQVQVVPKQEEANAEAPKQEEANAEAPPKNEANAEAPK
ncbi:uncharacterized protein zgc:174935 [Cololabis saira]|uniref:uncharacterized protein zgc:174935 n=1 Tax=Cololabis saira TaxID=129043 RepID=UPI002AD4B269|nr:uncharacterized protein zgc:174935 [Cololabis saira]